MRLSTAWQALRSPTFASQKSWERLSTYRVKSYLSRIQQGIVHVGANIGQERKRYAELGLNVLWIEPIPNVFARLIDNIRPYPNQRALLALVTEMDGESVLLNISNNDGRSSSVLPLAAHKEIWPDVDYIDTLDMVGRSLPSLLAEANLMDYDALILDTQGTELRILKGAAPILTAFDWIQVEAADFEAYQDCARANEITSFMAANGFYEWARMPKESGPSGRYYEIVYRNSKPAR